VTLIRSIMLMAGVAACVSFAIFAGHALSTHHLEPVYLGLAVFAVGALLLFAFNRTGRDSDAAGRGH
jgi:hypothetical protein